MLNFYLFIGSSHSEENHSILCAFWLWLWLELRTNSQVIIGDLAQFFRLLILKFSLHSNNLNNSIISCNFVWTCHKEQNQYAMSYLLHTQTWCSKEYQNGCHLVVYVPAAKESLTKLLVCGSLLRSKLEKHNFSVMQIVGWLLLGKLEKKPLNPQGWVQYDN